MLPRAVQDAAKLAESIQSQLANPSNDTRVEETQPLESAQESTQPTAEPAKPADESNKPSQTYQQPNEDQDASYWRHRFEVVQGKYNAEVPALRERVKTLEEQLASSAPANQQHAAERAAEAISDLSQTDIDEYGPELIALIEKVAGAKTQLLSTQVSKANQELEQMREEKAQDAQARFWMELRQNVPNLDAINSSTEFLKWLDGVDPKSGSQRQALLNSAQQRLDARSITAIFKEFESLAATPQRNNQHLQQPHQSRSSDNPMGERTFTREQVTQFYKDAALGKYTDEQKAALDKEIFEAQKGGRII
ncbi:MAG: hypothetical protein ACPGMR_03280 [Pontibacterium sp.]